MSDELDSGSECSFDEDEVNVRLSPDWAKYRLIIERGQLYRLDTCRDVREHYERYGSDLTKDDSGYSRACSFHDDNALCKDAGLVCRRQVSFALDSGATISQPDNLFRGSRVPDGMKIMVKAVHLRSREYDIMRFLSKPPLVSHPMNHSIRAFRFPRKINMQVFDF